MTARPPQSSEGGFTMIEAVVSMVVFGIVSLGVCKSFVSFLKKNTDSERKTEAALAAQQTLDSLRMQDPAAMPMSGSASQNITIGRRTFQSVTTYCSPSTYCTASSSRFITVEVRYNGQKQLRVSTIFAQLR